MRDDAFDYIYCPELRPMLEPFIDKSDPWFQQLLDVARFQPGFVPIDDDDWSDEEVDDPDVHDPDADDPAE
jgi:hypothetical protein